jgi:hypothetical protein
MDGLRKRITGERGLTGRTAHNGLISPSFRSYNISVRLVARTLYEEDFVIAKRASDIDWVTNLEEILRCAAPGRLPSWTAA